MADSDSDESFSGFSDIGSDIDVNLAGNFDGEISVCLVFQVTKLWENLKQRGLMN